MNGLKFLAPILIFFIAGTTSLKAQPIPIELMMGTQYGAVDLAFNKQFSQGSRLGFFHQNTVQFDYNEPEKHSFILQDLLTVETLKNLRVTGGVAYSKGGFSPTAGLQYLYSGEKFLFLCAPRINIEHDYSYDIMTILQYKQPLNDRIKLYTRIKLLNVFDNESNIKSYQWFRLGLEMKGIQFGLALNLDEYGPKPSVETSAGLFVRKEIF